MSPAVLAFSSTAVLRLNFDEANPPVAGRTD